jgi:hypothetical protein
MSAGQILYMKSFFKIISYLFDIVSHIISISFFFLLVSKSIIFLTYMIKYIYQQKKSKKKGETLLYRAKIDTLPTLQKKKNSSISISNIRVCA